MKTKEELKINDVKKAVKEINEEFGFEIDVKQSKDKLLKDVAEIWDLTGADVPEEDQVTVAEINALSKPTLAVLRAVKPEEEEEEETEEEEEEETEEEEEEEKPVEKKKAAKSDKKEKTKGAAKKGNTEALEKARAARAAGGPSFEQVAHDLLKKKANDKEWEKVYTELYKKRGNTDKDFIKKRIAIYRKIAEKSSKK